MSGILTGIQSYCAVHHAAVLTKVAGGICAISAAQLAIRAVGELYQAFTAQNNNNRDKCLESFAQKAGCAVLFGLLAANVIPGSALCGAAVLVGASIMGVYRGNEINSDAILIVRIIDCAGRNIVPTTVVSALAIGAYLLI